MCEFGFRQNYWLSDFRLTNQIYLFTVKELTLTLVKVCQTNFHMSIFTFYLTIMIISNKATGLWMSLEVIRDQPTGFQLYVGVLRCVPTVISISPLSINNEFIIIIFDWN